MANGADPILDWLQVLDELTYYELLGIAPSADADDVRTAFHAFCDTFHPDRHFGRSHGERESISTIFKRATEAHLVLSDAALRGRYDVQIAASARSRPPRVSFSPHSHPPQGQSAGPAKLEDAARSQTARPFARRADELIQAGDFRQAKLQLVMANHMDPDNDALQAALKDVETKLRP
jgi:DnaJ-class molecular chaperone